MTTIIEKVYLEPLEKSIRELQTPLFLINGKLERIDWSNDHRHIFRFIEIIAHLTRRSIPESIFTEAFLQFQYLSELLQESHSNDLQFNYDDMLAYFLALLDNTLIIHGKELRKTDYSRILRFWGVDSEFSVFVKKVIQAKTILENAKLLRFNADKRTDELHAKVNLLLSYIRKILPPTSEELEKIFEEVSILIEKKVIPYANMTDAALTMIVAYFPYYLNMPALRLFITLHFRKDFQINLSVLRKNVERYRTRLKKCELME